MDYPGPITKRCICGAPLEWYGTKRENGLISTGWHTCYEAYNSADANLCSKCYSRSLSDREFAKEANEKVREKLMAEMTPMPSTLREVSYGHTD